MKHFTLVTSLAVAVTAIPKPIPASSVPNVLPTYLQLGENASNCEVYQKDNGHWDMRYIEGMGPGSAHYRRHVEEAVTKRDDEVKTQVTFNDDMVVYGCGTNPGDVQPIAILDQLSSICKESGACLDSEITQDIQYVSPSEGDISHTLFPNAQLKIRADGVYPTWLRNGMVAAVQGVVNEHLHRYSQEWVQQAKKREAPQIAGPSRVEKTCEMVQGPGFIHVARFVNDNLQGFVKVVVEMEKSGGTGFCKLFDFAAAGSSVIPTVGAPAAAIFGVASVVCELAADG